MDIDELSELGSIGVRTRNALANAAIRSLSDFADLTPTRFLALKGAGVRCLTCLNEWLISKGQEPLKGRHCPTCTCAEESDARQS